MTARSAGPFLAQDEDLGGGESFAACVRGERDARLVLLMDESRSLQNSDPDAARVDAAQHLMRTWASQVEGSDIDLQIQVMAYFDDGRATTDWMSVTETDALVDHLESYRERAQGDQTDYLMGLDAARSALTGPAEEIGSPCKAIVWFSDGKLEAGARYQDGDEDPLKPYIDEELEMADVTQIAEDELCREGGAADQVRAAGVDLVGIGLASEVAGASDFDLMRSITTEASCGALPPRGSFLLAQDLEELLFAFSNVARPETPVTQDSVVCQGDVQEECLHTFVLDDSISGVNMMLTSEVPGLDVVIVPPEGDPVTLSSATSGELDAGTAAVDIDRLSERTSNVAMEAAGAWRGRWGVGLVDPESSSAASVSQSSLHLTADIQPVWLKTDEPLRSGEASEQRFGLQRQDGTQIDPGDLLGSMALDIVFRTPGGDVLSVAEALDAEGLLETRLLDLADVDPGRGTMEYTLNLTTAGFEAGDGTEVAGTELAPLEVRQRVDVQPPVGLPEISPSISFGQVLDGASAEAKLAVTGPGCVWVAPDTAQVLAGPASASPVSVSSEASSADTCLSVEEGETASLPLLLETAGPALGGLNGQVEVHLAPLEDTERQVQVARPFSADLDKTPDAGTWWATFALLVALGVGIPVALMYATKWRSTHIPGRSLFAETFALELKDGNLLPGSYPHQPGPEVFRDPRSVPRAGTKVLEVGQARLKAVQGWSPLGTGEVHATIPGMVGVSDTSSEPTSTGAARLPLAVHNHWAVFRDAEGTAAVLLLLPGIDRRREDLVEQLRTIEADVDRKLEAIVASGVSAAEASRGAARGAARLRAPRRTAADERAVPSAASAAFIGADVDVDAVGQDFSWDEPTSWTSDAEPQGPAVQRPRPGPSSGEAADGADDWDIDFDFGSGSPRS